MTNVTWHRGIGADINSDMSIDEQLAIAGLDWYVYTSPITYGLAYNQRTSNSRKAVYRSDTGMLLDTASQYWQPFQNRDIVETFHQFCDKAGLTVDHLGSLHDGRTIFASAELPVTLDIREVGDIVKARIILLNYHTVGKGLQVKLQAERLVCTNGMTMPIRHGSKVITHVGGFDASRIDRLLGATFETFENYAGDAQKLASTEITYEQAILLLINAFGDPHKPVHEQPKVVETCLSLFCGLAKGSEMLSAYNTAWGLLNAVTEHINHGSQVRGGTATHLGSLLLGNKAAKQASFAQQLVSVAAR